MNYKLDHATSLVMLEDTEQKTRYEFFTVPIRKNNLTREISYYEPVVRTCIKFATGSTFYDRRYAVEAGNELYKRLINDGYTRVSTRSFA